MCDNRNLITLIIALGGSQMYCHCNAKGSMNKNSKRGNLPGITIGKLFGTESRDN